MARDLKHVNFQVNRNERDIENIKKQLKEVVDFLEEFKGSVKKLSWQEGKDERKIGGLTIEANYSSWKTIKESDREDAFFIETEDTGQNSNELTIEEAKELIEYLQQKVDYLEGN